MYATNNGHLECVKLLLPHEINIKDKDGKSALDYAENEEIRKIIQDYIEKENDNVDSKEIAITGGDKKIIITIANN